MKYDKNQVLLVVLTAAVCVLTLINLCAFVFFTGGGSAIESGLDDASTAPQIDTTDLKALTRGLQQLNRNLEAFNQNVEETAFPSPASGEEKERITPEKEGTQARLFELISELNKALKRAKVISNVDSTLNASMRETFSGVYTDLFKYYGGDRAAKQDLMFMTYGQVLQQLGPPIEIYSDEDGVRWCYTNGVIYFCDGLMSRAEIWDDESEG